MQNKDENMILVKMKHRDTGQEMRAYLYKPQMMIVTQMVTMELLASVGWEISEMEVEE